jgi:hypothetical protein
MNLLRNLGIPTTAILLLVGCSERRAADAGATSAAAACGADARDVVDRFGRRMRDVSVLAPDTVVRRELRDAYGALATDSLLRAWESAPANAPGREVSSPWPARIEIATIEPADGGCRVRGNVVYATSVDTTAAAGRRSVTLVLRDSSGWRISDLTVGAADQSGTASSGDASSGSPSSGGAPSDGATAATDSTPASVVRRYYAALQSHDYDAAYALWRDAGRASGQTRAEFAKGFAQTERVRVSVGDDVLVEGAAGSQYATVPVTVDAVLRDGRRQHFEGTYTLRRAMVDGATAEERRWGIYKAELREAGQAS